MSSYILDKSYAIEDSGGVGAFRAVVCGKPDGTADYVARLPIKSNEGRILGVTVHSQSLQGGYVAVRKAGIARVVAGGAIEPGDPLNINGPDGRVKAIDEAHGTPIQCLGFAETAAVKEGDIVEIFISIHERTAP